MKKDNNYLRFLNTFTFAYEYPSSEDFRRWVSRDIVTNILAKVTHNFVMELVWTILPTLILILIAIPSLKLLYFMENPFAASDISHTEFYYKVIGHQWYWSYEYSFDKIIILTPKILSYKILLPENLIVELESNNKIFDSYMLNEDDTFETHGFRLLEVDNPLVIKSHTKTKFLITSSDVLHAWSIPALGMKIDAVPGRLSLLLSLVKHSGIYYGQCSEICGINHGFMPIKLICK